MAEITNSSEETASILRKRHIRAISLLAGLPILCLSNNFERSKSLLLWSKGETASCSSSIDDTTAESGEEELVQKEDDHDLELQCVICLISVNKYEKYRVLGECSHGFHANCIDDWLMENSTCPLCRCSVAYIPARKRQQLRIGSEDEDQEAFLEAVKASFLSFLDHLWKWFLNPLEFDDSWHHYAFLRSS